MAEPGTILVQSIAEIIGASVSSFVGGRYLYVAVIICSRPAKCRHLFSYLFRKDARGFTVVLYLTDVPAGVGGYRRCQPDLADVEGKQPIAVAGQLERVAEECHAAAADLYETITRHHDWHGHLDAEPKPATKGYFKISLVTPDAREAALFAFGVLDRGGTEQLDIACSDWAPTDSICIYSGGRNGYTSPWTCLAVPTVLRSFFGEAAVTG